MNRIRSTSLAGFITLLLCSCNPGTTVSTDKGNVVAQGDRITLRADGRPNAHIDEAGNLLIDGDKVEVTARQRALLQHYQREFKGMTEDGIAIGKQGAAMAGKAVSAAIKGAMSGGGGQDIEKTMEAEARLMEREALKLCERLVVIRSVQDELAAELPAFQPYATIDSSDVAECSASGEEATPEPSLQAKSEAPAAD